MIGKPKFKLGDEVMFTYKHDGRTQYKKGKIYIIDAHGTFEQSEDVSYDIMEYENGEEKCLYKHITEPYVIDKDLTNINKLIASIKETLRTNSFVTSTLVSNGVILENSIIGEIAEYIVAFHFADLVMPKYVEDTEDITYSVIGSTFVVRHNVERIFNKHKNGEIIIEDNHVYVKYYRVENDTERLKRLVSYVVEIWNNTHSNEYLASALERINEIEELYGQTVQF